MNSPFISLPYTLYLIPLPEEKESKNQLINVLAPLPWERGWGEAMNKMGGRGVSSWGFRGQGGVSSWGLRRQEVSSWEDK